MRMVDPGEARYGSASVGAWLSGDGPVVDVAPSWGYRIISFQPARGTIWIQGT